MNDVCRLRDTISTLDGEILRLIAARMDAARAIGRAKQDAGVPLRDYAVERQVLDRAERRAETLGLPRELARSIARLLMRESRAAQAELRESTVRGTADEILLVGGLGKMGRWFDRFFRNQGLCVRVCDPAGAAADGAAVVSLREGLRSSRYALVATPLDHVPAALAEIASTGFKGVVFDMASLKGHLKPAIAAAKAAGLAITSIHPMFGPDTRALADKVICLCDCGDPAATEQVASLFRETAATLVRLSLDEHDQLMSLVLGLSHLVNIVFATVLSDTGVPYKRLREVGSTTFLSQMRTTAPVACENAELYYAIQRFNAFTPEVHAGIRRALASISDMVQSGDREQFVAMMSRCRQWVTQDGMDGHDSD